MQKNYDERFGRILGEWKRFINSQPLENPLIIPEFIMDSWTRCREHHVNPYTTRVNKVLAQKELDELLERNANLVDISRPFMRNLYGFVRGSGFVVALFDDRGYMLDVLGDEDVLERVKQGNFVCGSCWTEEEAGTN
ncbi:MAG: sigma-54-dependent Fis family transcriptional regulator, partial [Deltaproteobacteria bacterium]|nr:sigma-54-dependent Fis family transcriptional regulator [Deltaproteobacteria bacterium]